ncbi:MAG: hypothetical protein KGQ87_02545 [Verrucomicrobia bacterium]|nr:hypothetical protein [Verrucomicrobiota bacterium]
MKKTVIALIAPVLGVAPAFAGDVSAPAQSSAPAAAANSYGLSPYLGVSGVFGEFDETVLTTLANEDGSYDVAGVRVNGGLGFGNGFSIDGRYEHVEGDLYDVDIESDEFRALVNYEQEITGGLSLFGGIGYGWLNHEAADLEISGDGFLLNAGAKFNSGQLFGSLVYTHCLTQSADVSGIDLEEEDVGSLEATVGYNITEQLAATLSVETQVTGDTWIEKDWVAAIGLQYKF